MALTISEQSSGGDYEVLQQGQYNATCYRVVDIGTHQESYEGETFKRHSVILVWETSDKMMKDGKPFSVTQQYNLSLHEKAKLRQHLVSWRQKQFTQEELGGFDLTKVLGLTCKLDVGHTSGGNPKVLAVYAPEGGVQKVATVNEQIAFDCDAYANDDKAECDKFVQLPEWMQDKIDESFEVKAGHKVEEPKTEEFGSLDAIADDKDEGENIPF
jgi:hypothetical protein